MAAYDSYSAREKSEYSQKSNPGRPAHSQYADHAYAHLYTQGYYKMIWVIRNLCYYETITDTDVKQIENNVETHKVFPEMFDTCSINHSANVNEIFELSSYTPQL
jgi:hypothetical protein